MNFESIRRTFGNLSWPVRRRDLRHRLGRRGERAAARFLKRKHYRILFRNYRCVAGEIDLICAARDMLVFVEVKTRSSDQAADLYEALREGQWRRIEHAARFFIQEHSAHDRPCRLDMVTVLWPPRGAPTIEHFEDAHQPRRQ